MASFFELFSRTPLLGLASRVFPASAGLFWAESLFSDTPNALSRLGPRAQAHGLSAFCKIGTLRFTGPVDLVEPKAFAPLLSGFKTCLNPAITDFSMKRWMGDADRRRFIFRPQQPGRKTAPPDPTIARLAIMDSSSWMRASHHALDQILSAKPSRSGLCAALLCSMAARPGRFWIDRLAPLIESDDAMAQRLNTSLALSAAHAGSRLMSSQIEAGSASTRWRMDWTQAQQQSLAHEDLFMGAFSERAQSSISWTNKRSLPDPDGVYASLTLAKALSPTQNPVLDCAEANNVHALLGYCLWGSDPNLPGSDGLRPVDVATRKGRALLYRALALAGADCSTKGKGSRKTPAELGRKLLRDDLGHELLSMAERAEILGSVEIPPPAPSESTEAPPAAPRRNRL